MKQIILSLILLLTVKVSYGQDLLEKISETDFTIGETIKIKSQLFINSMDLTYP